ncbi:nuclear protein localization protein 4 homolog [Melanaphis sacchari]|nr:nuclear protein localization protein 4 homolog [Melanaphis sacchari]
MAGQIVLRVESPDGTKRVQVSLTESSYNLFEKVYNAFSLTNYGFTLFNDRNRKNEIKSSKSVYLSSLNLKHGDKIYLCPLDPDNIWAIPGPSNADSVNGSRSSSVVSTPGSSTSLPSNGKKSSGSTSQIEEDEVDKLLWKLDGKIKRLKDKKYCRHGDNGCCVHCSPLEPYDEEYLKTQNMKHLSFHSYLRKMTAGVAKGKFLLLENISCKIKEGCAGHLPWPKGICSKCQPSAITLNRQTYRHVDNVMFENSELVERFLNYWRITGHQRIGFLYGRYEMHPDIPLGIRAVVAAIYEPPQESSRDHIKLLPDEKQDIVNELARCLGLTCVGWIFTDLLTEDMQNGTVKYVRNIKSHFLSAQECIMAGYFQNLHPNPCRYASNGYFGSKFVTVCVTGDEKCQVHMEGYSVSNQCMALVKDDCLVPTKDVPELGFVRESSDKQYVPDVYYKEKDSYGNEVSKLARPLPVEYLLLDVPASTPLIPLNTFTSIKDITKFPVENRLIDGHIQDFDSLCKYLRQFTPSQFYESISDFHFLLYIATMDMLPMKDSMAPLLEAIRSNDKQAVVEWSRSDVWATLEQLISNTSDSAVSGHVGNGFASVQTESWTCIHCTFMNNSDRQSCDICRLPRDIN